MWDAQTNSRFAGLEQVAVNCNYVTNEAKHIQVTVAYALPTDFNPNSDFYFGCGSEVTPWTPSGRTFNIASPTQWALASFNDLLGQIDERDARAFENVTRQLLRNADGYAHACTLKVAPTLLTSRFTFSFEVSNQHAQGSFSTQGPLTKSESIPVVKVTAPNIVLRFDGARGRLLIIKVKHGLDYHPPIPTIAQGRVRLAVEIVKSGLSACQKGATGTLVVTTAPSVRLIICRRTFLSGKATVHILEIS